MPNEPVETPRDRVEMPKAASVSGLPAKWAITAMVVHAIVMVWAFHTVRFDDAFIVYRYGQNLGVQSGRGESTTVLGVALSAMVHRLAGHEAMPSVMAALGCLAWSAQSVLLYLVLHPLAPTYSVTSCGALSRINRGTSIPPS